MDTKIALVGNPNCGKTTMFNSLTKTVQYVGNWPGVTVEKKEGKIKGKENIFVTDLPGVYSLSPYTKEEVVSRNYLASNESSSIINIVDATNIERHLYLTTQILELEKPVVIALNMVDSLKKSGSKIDTQKLSTKLGCKIVETSALFNKGIQEVSTEAIKACNQKVLEPKQIFSLDIENAINQIKELCLSCKQLTKLKQTRWIYIKILERDFKIIEEIELSTSIKDQLERITCAIEQKYNDNIESIITKQRYSYIDALLQDILIKSNNPTISDKIDRIVTDKILGIPIFVLVMWFVFKVAISTFGTMATSWVNDVLFGKWITANIKTFLLTTNANAVLTDCILNGVLGGLGTILSFIPQIAILFFLLSILEDCGYMVRIAFVMDRVLKKFGLSGKSFIPLLVASGCGVPGVMASRTIENENNRRMTIITTTWIPCGAKLPVIALMASVIASKLNGFDASFLAPLMYLIGVFSVILASIALKKTKYFYGCAAPFVMELPQYHIPQLKTILLHTWERCWSFIKNAGTALFIACLIMWFLSNYGFTTKGFAPVNSEYSILARLGGILRYIFIPLGWGEQTGGWQTVASCLSGISAKEAIVSTMGVLANSANNQEEASSVIKVIGTWFTTGIAGFSFLLFNMLNSPCISAILAMKAELKDRKWFLFALVFQNIVAYSVTLIFYQLGMFFVHGVFGITTIITFVLLSAILYALLRKNPYATKSL